MGLLEPPDALLDRRPLAVQGLVEPVPPVAGPARWDGETLSLVLWFLLADGTLPTSRFGLPRPGRPGGYATASDPPAVYARLRDGIAAGPVGAPARSGRLARELGELYGLLGPVPGAGTGAAA